MKTGLDQQDGLQIEKKFWLAHFIYYFYVKKRKN